MWFLYCVGGIIMVGFVFDKLGDKIWVGGGGVFLYFVVIKGKKKGVGEGEG